MPIINMLPQISGWLELELLWTNPNPNSQFGAQNITFENGLNDYQFFMIETKGHISNVLSNVRQYIMAPTQFT